MRFYSREVIRKAREDLGARSARPDLAPSMLASIPPDAPMDDAVITVWNGERFVAWDDRLATARLEAVETKPDSPGIPGDVVCVAGDCGNHRIWLAKDGERWFMFVGLRGAAGRRKDFASPFLEHAIRTAEAWYGVPGGGWRAEKRQTPTEVQP